jgi:hypothetical protein
LLEALYVSAADVPQEETESAHWVQLMSRKSLTLYTPKGDYIYCYH